MTFVRSSILISGFIASLLVLAQTQLLVHEAHLDAHADEESCEICIQYLKVGHATPSAFAGLTSFNSAQPLLHSLQLPGGGVSFFPNPPSRAPPAFSLS